jgi:tight adherence protein C
MSVFVPALMGLVFYAGCSLLWRAFVPKKLSLDELVAAAAQPPQHQGGGWLERTVRSATGTERFDNGVASDLAVLGREPEQYALGRIAWVVAMSLMPLVFIGFAVAVGVRVQPLVVMVVCSLFGAGGWLLARLDLSSKAAIQRQAFVGELASYLQLVALFLAGGAGPDEAMRRAASTGESVGVAQIRAALDLARVTNRSPWDALEDLAKRTRVPELQVLIASVKLSERDGARVKGSLMAKADTLRAAKSAEDRAAAERTTERMGLPIALMVIAYLGLIIAPALGGLSAVGGG